MAWCYYCRRYTVNGRCPVCNRMYEEPNKRYDFYGKEIKPKTQNNRKSSTNSSKSSSSGYSSSSYSYSSGPGFWSGFWLGIAINFGALIIAIKTHHSSMRNGAIVGMVINTLFTLYCLEVIGYAFLKPFFEIALF